MDWTDAIAALVGVVTLIGAAGKGWAQARAGWQRRARRRRRAKAAVSDAQMTAARARLVASAEKRALLGASVVNLALAGAEDHAAAHELVASLHASTGFGSRTLPGLGLSDLDWAGARVEGDALLLWPRHRR